MALDLNQSPRTAVFRALVDRIRRDPTISRVIGRPSSFRAWTGDPADSQPFTVDIAPCLRFTPSNGPDTWEFPNAQRGTLFLNVEMVVFGSNYDDVLNLWWAVEKAIYPTDPTKRLDSVAALQVAGALTGLAEFSQPAFDPSPSDNYFAAMGQIKIEVRLDINN